jgi:predicted small secreted protein
MSDHSGSTVYQISGAKKSTTAEMINGMWLNLTVCWVIVFQVKTMKYGIFFLLAATFIAVSGCSHTVQGIQKDTRQNAPVVQAAAQQAGQSLQQAASSTDKVVTEKTKALDQDAKLALLATDIKAKIIAKKPLDDSPNNVMVTSSSSEIYLKGHVASPGEKSQVDAITKEVLVDHHASTVIINQLVPTNSAGTQ